MPQKARKDLENIIKILKNNSPIIDEAAIRKAFEFAKNAHKDQQRKSGELFIYHPLTVAEVLASMGADDKTVIAALLHDTVEDNAEVSIELIREVFGEEIGVIVEGLTKIEMYDSSSVSDNKMRTYQKFIFGAIKDLRVLFVKLADRYHNMQTLQTMRKEKRVRIAKETLDIYAPLANMCGIHFFKRELEDLAFENLYPEEYERISEEVRKVFKMSFVEMDKILRNAQKDIEALLESKGIKARVIGRVKHKYSIYRKLQTRKRSIEEVKDLMALRVILDSENENDCYRVKNIITAIYSPLGSEINDFISAPKANNYKSLHVKVFYKHKILEVQIRTEAMDEVAEYGAAAHWRYKANSPLSANSREDFMDQYLSNLKKIATDVFSGSSEADEKIDDLKTIIQTSAEIYVYTPKNELIVLPKDSIAIDFAYAIHSKVGNYATIAKINGTITSLSTKLESGDLIEIITTENKLNEISFSDMRDLIELAKTTKARNSLRKIFYQREKDNEIKLGEEVIRHRLNRHKVKYDLADIEKLYDKYNVKTKEEFFKQVYNGAVNIDRVVRQIMEKKKQNRGLFSIIKPLLAADFKRKVDLEDHFATCCKPDMNSAIVGVFVPKTGYVIHKKNCKNLKKYKKDELLPFKWDVNNDPVTLFIGIIAEDRKRLLLDVVEVITNEEGITMKYLRVKPKGNVVEIIIEASFERTNQYLKLQRKLAKITNVIEVFHSKNKDDLISN